MDDAWIAFGSALAGAVVGGAVSFLGSYVVERWRLRRQARVLLYDQQVRDAERRVVEWRSAAEDGHLYKAAPGALDALDKVWRTAVVAGRSDRQQVEQWAEARKTLHSVVDRSRAFPSEPQSERLQRQGELTDESAAATGDVLTGLRHYLRWLEQRL